MNRQPKARKSTPDRAVDDPALHTRRGFIAGLGGAGAVAALAGTILIEDPASAEWNDSAGPNFIRVIDVTYFGAKGDGGNDSVAIGNALEHARTLKDGSGKHSLPVYFPAGTYGIHEPLAVNGLHLIGEPSPLSVGGGSVIKALSAFGQDSHFANGKTAVNYEQRAAGLRATLPAAYDNGVPMLYCGGFENDYYKNGEVVANYKATQLFHMSGITLDADHQAHFCLALLGASGTIDGVRCFGPKLDGFLIDGGAPCLNNITVDKADRHGIYVLNANGALFSELFVNYGANPSTGGSAFRLVGAKDTPTGRGTSGAVTITRAQTGDLYANDSTKPRKEAAPAIYLTDVSGGRISNVYIETGNCPSAVKLEGCVNVHLEDCRMSTNRTEPDAAAIHLTSSPRTACFGNVIRGNYCVTDLDNTGQPAWTKAQGSNRMIRVRVDPASRNNHIVDNMRLELYPEEMLVWYPREGGPVDPKVAANAQKLEMEYVPSVRTHTLGQRHVISYSPMPPDPKEGSWHEGDIVFNSAPAAGEPAGWVACVHPQGGIEFLKFGQIGST